MNKIKIKKFFKKLISIRLVLCLAIVISAILPLIITSRLVILGYQSRTVEELLIDVKSQCNLLAADIAASSYLTGQSSQNVDAELEQLAYIYSSRILIVDSDFKIVKDTYVFDEGKTLVSPEILNAYKGTATTKYDNKIGYAEIIMPVYSVDNTKTVGVISVTITEVDASDTVQYLNSVCTAMILIFLLMSIVFAVIFSEILIRPLNRLNKSIVEISVGASEHNIESRSLYEYNRICNSVNVMLDRLSMLDKSRQEFVSNVSHELKTPMTSMKVLADSLVSQEDVPNEMYKEFMQDIVHEIDRENQIISSLLTMVKLDKSNAEMVVKTVNVNELVELILKRLRPIAVQKNVELVLESFRPVAAEIDEVKFTLAITNLIENSIKYNVDNGWVHVSLNADHKFFYVKVADSGIGIPNECKDQIFERFYRVDKARARETGGTGLGLALTKSVILMHKGTIKLYSKENEGTTFTVRIPLYYSQTGGEQ